MIIFKNSEMKNIDKYILTDLHMNNLEIIKYTTLESYFTSEDTQLSHCILYLKKKNKE